MKRRSSDPAAGCGRQDAARHQRHQAAEEGLLVSLDRKGLVDLPYIAELYGKPGAAGRRRTGRPDLPRPRYEAMGNRRRLPVGQRPGQARRRREGRT